MGARVLVDEWGGVTLQQGQGPGEPSALFFEAEEAKEVAAALVEVADAVIAQRNGQCKSQS